MSSLTFLIGVVLNEGHDQGCLAGTFLCLQPRRVARPAAACRFCSKQRDWRGRYVRCHDMRRWWFDLRQGLTFGYVMFSYVRCGMYCNDEAAASSIWAAWAAAGEGASRPCWCESGAIMGGRSGQHRTKENDAQTVFPRAYKIWSGNE